MCVWGLWWFVLLVFLAGFFLGGSFSISSFHADMEKTHLKIFHQPEELRFQLYFFLRLSRIPHANVNTFYSSHPRRITVSNDRRITLSNYEQTMPCAYFTASTGLLIHCCERERRTLTIDMFGKTWVWYNKFLEFYTAGCWNQRKPVKYGAQNCVSHTSLKQSHLKIPFPKHIFL